MNLRHKAFLRLNLMSLFFIAVSFISVTLAWFAYSGLAKVSTEVEVKAWYIELGKDGETVSNNIVISLADIYPGMETVSEVVSIKNLGDSDAGIKYSIISARILSKPEDEYIVDGETITSPYVEDILSHQYPFHININLSKGYALSKGEESFFEVSISWPLDSDHDELDSIWGTAAYDFQQSEEEQKNQDPEYQIRPSIQVVISVTAEQYIETDTSSDINFNLGDIILFDVMANERCDEISETCIQTYVMDVDNKLGDDTVTLLPNPMINYMSGTFNDYNTIMDSIVSDWVVNTRPLVVDDLLKIISTDVMNSALVRENLSNSIIGNLNYGDRISNEIATAINYNGYYSFINERFNNFTTTNCYWTSSEYNDDYGFAIEEIDEDISKIYGLEKTTSCNVIPVIIASKANL